MRCIVSMFAPAAKRLAKARIGIDGPSGSGKTWSALAIARGLVGDAGRIALADTEHGSAHLYADLFAFDHARIDPPYTVGKYEHAIHVAAEEGYDVLILDTLTHAWKGEGGVLDQVDDAKRRTRGNDFSAWQDGSKQWRALLDAMLAAPLHIIATMRSKTEYALETDSRGKQVPRKIGMAPEARDGIEYEYSIMLSMDHEHVARVTKSRWSELADAVVERPGKSLGESIAEWLGQGSEESPEAPQVSIDVNVSPDTRKRVAEAIDHARNVGVDVDAAAVREYAWKSEAHAEHAIEKLHGRAEKATAGEGDGQEALV